MHLDGFLQASRTERGLHWSALPKLISARSSDANCHARSSDAIRWALPQEGARRSRDVLMFCRRAAIASRGRLAAGAVGGRAHECVRARGPMLVARTGTWEVVSTVQMAPDAEPIVTTGLVAERTMI